MYKMISVLLANTYFAKQSLRTISAQTSTLDRRYNLRDTNSQIISKSLYGFGFFISTQ